MLPNSSSRCHVGALTCGSFVLVIIYSVLLLSFALGIGIKDLWRRRQSFFQSKGGRIQLPVSPAEYDRLDLSHPLAPENEENAHIHRRADNDDGSMGQRWKSTIRSLVGANSTSQAFDGDSVARSSSSTTRQPQSGASSANLMDSDSNNTLSRHHLGRGASLLSPDVLSAYSQPRTYRLNTILSNAFYTLGLACASSPWTTIAIGLTVCGLLNAGWSRFAIEKDPVRLWVAQGSELATQKQFFDEHFGPFYRTEQIFLSISNAKDAPVLDWARVQWWADVEKQIRNLVSPAGTSLKDVCFAPSASSGETPQVWDCTVQSFMGYFGDSLETLSKDTWSDELDTCATTPTECLSSAGQPLNPRLLFGGIPHYSGQRGQMSEGPVEGSKASAIVITYVVDNSVDQAKIARAEEWEHTLKSYLQNLVQVARFEHNIDLSFSTGVSLEEELNRSTNTDVPIVVLSYLVMFFYVSISLGGTGTGLINLIWAIFRKIANSILRRKSSNGPIALSHSRETTSTTPSLSSLSKISVAGACRSLLVDSKFLPGLLGIAIVLVSVSTSVGLFSLFGVRVTLIIAEVIPFLVLAIGVDNVFILAHELERQNVRAYALASKHTSSDEHFDSSDLTSVEDRMAMALGRMGPSILLSSTCQTLAFALGATVGMPAVRNFAIYAAGAVAINALLQITVFVAAMSIDLKRTEVSCLNSVLSASHLVGWSSLSGLTVYHA